MSDGDQFWGELVRTLREEQMLSQRQLAKLAKVNRSTLRRIEDGTARGAIGTIERLLNLMGYEIEAYARESLLERMRRTAAAESDPVQRSKIAAQTLLAMTP